ncbi:AEC family transporter [soil metagenome]
MGGVLIGFAIIAVVIGIGYLVGRFDLLGAGADRVLNRLAFFVFTPALLFTIVAEADVRKLFSQQLPVAAIAAGSVIIAYFVIARFVWRRGTPESTIGALSSGYVNAGNIGVPLSVYVLGDAAASAPTILLQLIVLAPIALTALDLTTSGNVSVARVLTQPLRNPLLIGSALGLILAVAGVELPAPVLAPFELVGAAAVPTVLILFGMSLHGTRPLAPGSERRDVLLASALKLVVMPVVAWLVDRFVFGMSGHELFVVVALAALPTAQNVFNYAQRYGRGVFVARDAIVVTTLLSIPVLVIVAALLAPV